MAEGDKLNEEGIRSIGGVSEQLNDNYVQAYGVLVMCMALLCHPFILDLVNTCGYDIVKIDVMYPRA